MKKQAFSMITAIIFIVLVGIVGVSTLDLSRSTISFTARNYIKEQADLVYEAAKQVAVDYWLKNGGVKKDQTREYRYCNADSCDFRFYITFIGSKDREDKFLDFDKETQLVRITVETMGAYKEEANIRIVKDFTIGN